MKVKLVTIIRHGDPLAADRPNSDRPPKQRAFLATYSNSFIAPNNAVHSYSYSNVNN